MGSLVIRSNNVPYGEVKSKTGDEQFQHQHVLEASKLINESSSSSSTSQHAAAGLISSQGALSEKAIVSAAKVVVIRQLKDRLSSLEEEAQLVRQNFIQSVGERKMLMSEIYEQFQFLRCCRDEGLREKSGKEARKRAAGLGQVLWLWPEEMNQSSLVIRDLKATPILDHSSKT